MKVDREIRFRGYENNSKVMWTNDNLSEVKLNEIQGKELYRYDGKKLEFTFMQNTGLKDKNGVEIYEGDILRIKFKIDNLNWDGKKNGITNVNIKRDVKFDNGGFFVRDRYKSKGKSFNYLLIDIADKSEIIGNIYENPELLEDVE